MIQTCSNPTHPMNVLKLLGLILFLGLPASAFAQAADQGSHLEGIRFLHMRVDTSDASDIKPSEQLDMSDIVELQLRRGDIDLRPYVANKPEENIPLVLVKIDTASRAGAGEFDLILQVQDHVTIDRNQEKTIATIYEMRRRANGGSGSAQIEAIKGELRELMSDFVSVFREQN